MNDTIGVVGFNATLFAQIVNLLVVVFIITVAVMIFRFFKDIKKRIISIENEISKLKK